MTYKNSEFSQKNSTLSWQRKQSYYDFLENQKPNSWLKTQSAKEKFLEKLLKELQLDYNKEHSFRDCVSPLGNRLRFDFCLLDKSSIPWKPLLVIEIQGKHHITDAYGAERFSEIIEHDRIKKEFCQKNNLPLLEMFGEDFRDLTAAILQKKINDILNEEDWTC